MQNPPGAASMATATRWVAETLAGEPTLTPSSVTIMVDKYGTFVSFRVDQDCLAEWSRYLEQSIEDRPAFTPFSVREVVNADIEVADIEPSVIRVQAYFERRASDAEVAAGVRA